jgi:hypothetical protein
MVDTLLEEGFDLETTYDTTQRALAVYLTPMQELVLGETASDEAIGEAAEEASVLVVSRVLRQRESSQVLGGGLSKEAVPEEVRDPSPTRFERDPVI